MILSLYRGVTTLAAPLISQYLKKRLARGKEHPTRFPERLGQASAVRPNGKLVWLHGASVGEAVSLLPLIDSLKATYQDWSILVTTGTVTSAALMEKRLPDDVIHQFVPVDRLPYVRKFLDHWKPDVAIWSESELWPNLLCETRKRGTQMALINARMSERSLQKWQRFKGLIRTLLSYFDLCFAQTDEDADRYRSLGALTVQCYGNLKYASGDLPADPACLAALSDMIGARPCWLAASTHPGEETRMASVHQVVKQTFPDLLTVIAPRHPERGTEIAAALRDNGHNVAQRSLNEQISADTDIYLADTLGEMGILYRLAPVVMIGKSLDPLGGQNPLEPARLDCAILCGPYMTNFAEIMDSLQKDNAVRIVVDEGQLSDQLVHFLSNADDRQAMAKRAKSVAHAKASVLEDTVTALDQLFRKA